MKQVALTVKENTLIADNVYRMVLDGDVGAITEPGQFINIKVDGMFLRRPISVSDIDTVVTGTKRIEKEAAEAFGAALYNAPVGKGTNSAEIQGTVTILYKVVGAGTRRLAACQRGEELDVLTGLGNGFDIRAAGDAPLLIGGGIGCAPLMLLAKALIADGVRPVVLLGFRSAADVILEQDLYEIGCDVYVVTEDGSKGEKGFVTDLMHRLHEQGQRWSYFYVCGPEPMLRAVYRETAGIARMKEQIGLEGQLSLEERMGCGFGACMGCSVMTKSGAKRVCKDGPVFLRSELLWE